MFGRFLLDSLQLILSPRNGWEDIAFDDFEVKPLLTKGFLPWLGLLCLTVLSNLFYSDVFTWLSTISEMIVMFLKYFITYFIAGFAFSVYMPSLTGNTDRERLNNTFLIFSLSLLALIDIIKNCLPIDLAVLNFFPLYVLFIMWRGWRYLKVTPGHHLGFVMLSFFAVIVPPYLLQLFFNIIFPY